MLLLHVAGFLAVLGGSLGQSNDTELISSPSGSGSSTAQCLAQGLNGECNTCVCCCYSGSSAFVVYLPTTDCECSRQVNGTDVKLAVVLAVIAIVPSLLASLYFNGQLCISPYKQPRRSPDGIQSPRRRRGMELMPR